MHYRHGRKEQPAACRLEKTPGGCDLIKIQCVCGGGGRLLGDRKGGGGATEPLLLKECVWGRRGGGGVRTYYRGAACRDEGALVKGTRGMSRGIGADCQGCRARTGAAPWGRVCRLRAASCWGQFGMTLAWIAV